MKANEAGKVTLRLNADQYATLFDVAKRGAAPLPPVLEIKLRLADDSIWALEFDAVMDTLASEIDPEFPGMRVLSVSLSQLMRT